VYLCKSETFFMDILSVCLTLAVWIWVKPWATLLTARTSELRPAQTLTSHVTHLRHRAHTTATTIYRQTDRQTEREIKTWMLIISKSTWNELATHFTSVLWHIRVKSDLNWIDWIMSRHYIQECSKNRVSVCVSYTV